MKALHLGDTGKEVTHLQRAYNKHGAAARGMPRLKVDGVYGAETDKASSRLSRALGALEQTVQQPGTSIGEQRIMRWPTSRNPAQLARARSRKQQAAAQAKRAAASTAIVSGNKVTGGTLAERIVAAARHALFLDDTGQRPSFYSQSGAWTVARAITGEKPGERSDCSQHVTGISWSAGAKDPNGQAFNGGYTGTLANTCTRLSGPEDGCLVIWDPYGPEGHVATVEDASEGLCIGHGSKHVVRHSISDFAYKGAPGYYRVPA